MGECIFMIVPQFVRNFFISLTFVVSVDGIGREIKAWVQFHNSLAILAKKRVKTKI